MRVGLCQIDTRVGDLTGNTARILAAVRAARDAGAQLCVFPELVLPGVPPRDLLDDEDFVDAVVAATHGLAEKLATCPPVLVGTVVRVASTQAASRHACTGGRSVDGSSTPPGPREPGSFTRLRYGGPPLLHNALALLEAGKIAGYFGKRLLPGYDVFHEPRWFAPAPPSSPAHVDGVPIGPLLCEDLWSENYPDDPGLDLRQQGARLLVCASASPYRPAALSARLHHARRAQRAHPDVGPAAVVYVNAVGAQDELIFDGRSFVLDEDGRCISMLAAFEERVEVIDLKAAPEEVRLPPAPPREAELRAALVLGIRDFARKNRVHRVYVGLSGGIDSALVACLATEALGASAVTAVALPSRHTDPRSTEAARRLATNLGVSFEVTPIETLHAAAETALSPLLQRAPSTDTTLENVQARLRAMVLMAYVNRRGGMLLNSSNKTELALGYGTLYGDMAGTLCVIGDLTKLDVYSVARHFDDGRGLIPRFILERPPTAELREHQVDPFDYSRVAPAVESILQTRPRAGDEHEEEEQRLAQQVRLAEHKRWQTGIILKVSDRAIGTGRMIPVTRG
ncbi:NAD(+) synthase [Chondromyces crocatus]|uniref:Glutamine-dependent NAD(+) synthetase n=1 Tax=Chondromyces crocatus TaxID=52 RepID=A0A0K1EQR7_CHOCO|nr:NAD(+) synthase [Chondromyces crocatus]AKT43270.1 uncharacterized protein CMC5_075010 [Chondromyces crocatus]